MSIPQPPKPAKLVIGVIIRDRAVLARLAGDLAQRFGPVDMVSPWFDFAFTDYYHAEMGAPLFRRVFSFERLIAQARAMGITTFDRTPERLGLALTLGGGEVRLVELTAAYGALANGGRKVEPVTVSRNAAQHLAAIGMSHVPSGSAMTRPAVPVSS